jgi:predicted Fe-Mo cluster-binding NifX family protein
MKIAVITDDERTLSQHFGRAAYYMVVTLENGKIVSRERRDKMGHAHFNQEPHAADEPGQPHGFGPQAHNRHLQMAEAIADCEALLCGGMGRGAYESMLARNIKPIVTDIVLIDEAALAYAQGKIVDQVEKLH